MTKDELIKALATETGSTQSDVAKFLEALGHVVQQVLASDDDLTLPGIGKFGVKERAARIGRNPSTGETIEIAAKWVPHFTPARALKEKLT